MASAVLMILATPLSLPFIKPTNKGKVSGIIFSGIGIGAVFSGFILPIIANFSIDFVWILLGIISLGAFLLSLKFFKHIPMQTQMDNKISKFKFSLPLVLLMLLAIFLIRFFG